MDKLQFLARVIAPGAWLALCFKGGGQSHMGQRFFPRGDLVAAEGFADWCVRQKMDVWHGLAAYKDAHQDGTNRGLPKYKGQRTQANVELLRCLWHDADIHRPGDGKAPGKTWADLGEVQAWVADLYNKTSLWPPNLWVRSGYGVHLYWILEEPIDQPGWQPYAEALKNLLIGHGGRGDLGLTTDSARILRPPGTFNFKVPASPQPVEVIDALTLGDYPNAAFFQALQPFVGLTPAPALITNSLPSGGPAGAYRSQANTAAAQTLPVTHDRRPHKALDIQGNGCLQIQKSLAEHGQYDDYDLWYLGWISLAVFLEDRDEFIHEVSDAHPKYVRANVDSHFTQALGEQQKKNTGGPLCAKFNTYRPGICGSCPHWGRIKSPLTLGTLDYDLPSGYRRDNGRVERMTRTPKGEIEWLWLVTGNVSFAVLARDHRTHQQYLTFTYQFDSSHQADIVSLPTDEIPSDGRCINFFMHYGINLLDNIHSNAFRKFIMAWIDKLRATSHETSYVQPFGWNRDEKGKFVGFALCDTLYRPDGTTVPIASADQFTKAKYAVKGDKQKWTDACNFIIKGRPDLQIVVAASFAAPLLELTGVETQGLAFSLWSQASATGKTSAILAGTTVWSSRKSIHQLDDTINAATFLMAQARSIPNYWDEVPPSDEAVERLALTLFKLGPGRNKNRASYATGGLHVIDPGEWSTIMVIANNRPLLEYVSKTYGHTEAGALRLFEICGDLKQPVPVNPDAGRIVGSLEDNRGGVGRAYASWISQNVAQIQADLQDIQTWIAADCSSKTSERFYVTFMTCIMVALGYADDLGFASFDYDAVYSLLKTELIKMRHSRGEDIPAVRNMTSPIDIIGKFMDDNRKTLIVVDDFPGPRNPFHKTEVIYDPTHDHNFNMFAAVHTIGYYNKTLRVSEEAFKDFCYKNKLSFVAARKQICDAFTARTVQKANIAGGTRYEASKRRVIDIPLDADPDLAHYLTTIPRDLLNAYLKLRKAPPP